MRLRTAVDTVVHVPFRVVEVEARSVNRHADLHVHTTPAVRPEPVSAKSVVPSLSWQKCRGVFILHEELAVKRKGVI